MKKIILFVFLFVVFCSTSSLKVEAYTKSISTDLVQTLQNNLICINYETMLSARNSIQFSFVIDNNYSNVMGYRAEANYRWYLRDVFPVRTTGIEGFNIGPYGAVGMYVWDNPYTDRTESDFYFEIGGTVAYKWVFSGFQVEPLLKLSIPLVKESYAKNFYWGFGVSLGYAW